MTARLHLCRQDGPAPLDTSAFLPWLCEDVNSLWDFAFHWASGPIPGLLDSSARIDGRSAYLHLVHMGHRAAQAAGRLSLQVLGDGEDVLTELVASIMAMFYRRGTLSVTIDSCDAK
jgi:hypothetical protein